LQTKATAPSEDQAVDAEKPSTSVQTELTTGVATTEEGENPGFMGSIGKLLMAIADPETVSELGTVL